MKLNGKIEIYLEIMRVILPYVRNENSKSGWKRLLMRDVYPELELVHNIPPLMRGGEVSETDVYWINVQAKNYADSCERTPRAFCDIVLCCIEDLVVLVPTELRCQLSWKGPSSSEALARLMKMRIPRGKGDESGHP